MQQSRPFSSQSLQLGSYVVALNVTQFRHSNADQRVRCFVSDFIHCKLLLSTISIRLEPLFEETNSSSIQVNMTGHTGGPHHGYPTGGRLPGPKHYSTIQFTID